MLMSRLFLCKPMPSLLVPYHVPLHYALQYSLLLSCHIMSFQMMGGPSTSLLICHFAALALFVYLLHSLYVCIYTHIYLYKHVYIIFVYIHIHTYIHIYIYIYRYVHIYVCRYTSPGRKLRRILISFVGGGRGLQGSACYCYVAWPAEELTRCFKHMTYILFRRRILRSLGTANLVLGGV